jgi:hypothetical protein
MQANGIAGDELQLGLLGLAGLSFFTSTQVVIPMIAPAPLPMAMGEFSAPPPGSGMASPSPFLCFFFFAILIGVAGRIIAGGFPALCKCQDCLAVGNPEVAFSGCDPDCPVDVGHIELRPGKRSRRNFHIACRSWQLPREVATVTPPGSIFTDDPSNWTRESESTVMVEPGPLIFATASIWVWRRSPEKIAEDERGMWDRFTQAIPLI